MLLAAFVILLIVIVICLCSIWGRPGEGIGIPVVAVATFAFVYLIEPVYMIWEGHLQYFLSEEMLVKGLLLPAAALLCLMWGWRRGSRGISRLFLDGTSMPGWSGQRLYHHGLAAACLGMALQVVFIERSGGFFQAYGRVHGAGFNWTENTAYLAMAPFWAHSGLAMMLVSRSKLKIGGWRRTAIPLFATALVLNGILSSSRTLVFSLCAILWCAWCLGRRSRPTIAQAAPALVIAFVGALLMLGYREMLHLGANKSKTPSLAEAATTGLTPDSAALQLRTSGAEFVVHALTLETVDKTHKYHLGINWLYLYTVALIPRIWWPNKPYRFETPGITRDDVLDVTGVRLAGGCAPGMVADLYSQFGVFSLLLFALLGWGARRLFLRAESGRTALAMCAYAIAFSLSLNAFGQEFWVFLLTFTYLMAPVVVYHWVERHRRRQSLGRLVARRALPASLIRSVC